METGVSRLPRLMCKKEIPREQAVHLIEKGKTDLIQGFTSKKGRPFDAFLVARRGARFAGNFRRARRRTTRMANQSRESRARKSIFQRRK